MNTSEGQGYDEGVAFPHQLFGGPGYQRDPSFPNSVPKHMCECGHLHSPNLKPNETWLSVYGSTPIELMAASVSRCGIFHCTNEDATWLQAVLNLYDGDSEKARVDLTRKAYAFTVDWPQGCFSWSPLTFEIRKTFGVGGIVTPNKETIRKLLYIDLREEMTNAKKDQAASHARPSGEASAEGSQGDDHSAADG